MLSIFYLNKVKSLKKLQNQLTKFGIKISARNDFAMVHYG